MSDLSETLGIATYRWPNSRVVVRLVGALDVAGAARLIDETTRIDPVAGDHLVVHMQDVPFLDSAGVGALYYTEAFVKARGGDFAISTPNPRVRALLGSAGFGGSLHGDASPTPESSPRQHCDRQRATSR